MNNFKKIIFYILIILTISVPFFMIIDTKAEEVSESEEEETEETAEKGDLRCPLVNSPNTTCTPKYDANGKVKSVELVFNTEANGGTLIVKKRVTKKKTLGHYDVEFEVIGNGVKQVRVPAPLYVMVIIDMSATISGKINAMEGAVKAFVKELYTANNSDIYFSLVQFASNVSVRQKFKKDASNLSFLGYNSGGLGKKSHVEKAYSKAISLFNEVPVSANKYLLLFGDGRYWSNADTDTGKIKPNANTLKKAGVTIFGARYKGYCSGSGLGRLNSAIRLGCTAGKSYNDCDATVMKAIISGSSDDKNKYYRGPSSDWDDTFKKIAEDMKKDAQANGYTYSTELTDEIGDSFFLVDGEGRYKKFNVGKLESSGTKFGPFEIEIDPYSANGWHETNEKFTFEYLGTDKTRQQFTVPENPEVYWVSNKVNIPACSGTATVDTVKTEDASDENNYYRKECYEGYEENGKKYKGYSVLINVNGFANGIKKKNWVSNITNFSLKGKEGIPISVELSTNMICTYTFKAKEFKEQYKSYEDSIDYYESILADPNVPESPPPPPETDENSTTEGGTTETENQTTENQTTESQTQEYTIYKEDARREILYIEALKEQMDEVLDTYIELTKISNLEEYKERFEEQEAVLKVDYIDSEEYDELELVNSGTPNTKIDCGKPKTEVINGKTIEVEKVCKSNFSKKMELPESCIDMQTGDQNECSPEIAQLAGGRLFFVDLKEDSAYLDVLIPSGGYRGNYNFDLKDDKGDPACSFDFPSEKIEFRQIELDDPFLKTYNPNREVGSNYLNNKYKFNFENIIHPDTWNDKNEAEYYYEMSKTNIANIKKDTAEDAPGSYLGRNCYFTTDNKYHCQFPRNELDGGSDNGDNWFYKFKAYDGIN